MANRVVLGRVGSNVVIGVSRPGVNVLSASASQQLWRTDIEVLRYGKQGTVTIAANGNADIPLGKSYSRTPMIFVGMVISGGGLRGPCADFRVRFDLGDNKFRINNRVSGTRTFHYLVYDNNVGQINLKSVQQNNGSWLFVP
jgi:hypothetical protein